MTFMQRNIVFKSCCWLILRKLVFSEKCIRDIYGQHNLLPEIPESYIKEFQ